MRCTCDGCLKQRAGNCLLNCFKSLVITFALSDTDMSNSFICHNCLNIREVKVDQRRHSNQVADTLDALMQHLVRNAERLDHARPLADDLQEPVIRDDNERIDALLEVRDARFRIAHPLLALKGERLGHNRDGQRALFAGNFRHDRRAARARAAAHARGDKHQVSTLECTRDFLAGFLCAAATDFRHRACAQTLGDFLTNLDFRLRAGHLQSLHVGIDGDELHAAQAGFDHAVDRVAAAAAASHDLDGSIIAGQLVILNFNHVASP